MEAKKSYSGKSAFGRLLGDVTNEMNKENDCKMISNIQKSELASLTNEWLRESLGNQ